MPRPYLYRIASGAIYSGGHGTIDVPLEFDTVEASILAVGLTAITGPISGTGGLTKSGDGGLTLSGTNTFSGPLTINAGNISFTSLQNLGADDSPIIINADVTSAGLNYFGNDTLVFGRDIQTRGGYAAFRTVSSAATFEVPGTISGPGGVGVTGNGYVALTGTNTYSGPTIVDGGLAISSDAALGSGILELKNVPGLKLLGPWTTNRPIVVSARTQFSTNGFDAVWQGPLTTTGSASLTKLGVGTLRIANGAGFSGGLSISAGTVALQGVVGDGSSISVTISAGAILTGRADVQGPILIFGTLAPGDRIGMLATANLSFRDGSTLALELDSASRYDQAFVTGTVSLTDAVQLALTLEPGFHSEVGELFTIILNDGTDGVNTNTGHFSYAGTPLDESAVFSAGGNSFQLSYVGGDGNDVTLRTVPEPGVAALLLCGVVGLGRTCARRSRAVAW